MIKSTPHSPSSSDAEVGTSSLLGYEKFASFDNFFCTRLWGEGADRPPEVEDLKLAAAKIQTLGDEGAAASTSGKASAAMCAELPLGVTSNTLRCQQDVVEAIVAEYAAFLQNEEDPIIGSERQSGVAMHAADTCGQQCGVLELSVAHLQAHFTIEQANDGGLLEQPNCVAASAFISPVKNDNVVETVSAMIFPTTEKRHTTVLPTHVVPTTQLACLPSPSSTMVLGAPLARRMSALGKLPSSFLGEEHEAEIEPCNLSEANEIREHVGDDQPSISFENGPDPLALDSLSIRDDEESLLTPKRVDRKTPRITPLKLVPTTSKRTRTSASTEKVGRKVRLRIHEMPLTPEHGKVHESEECTSPKLKSPTPCFSDEIKAHASTANLRLGSHAIVNGAIPVPPQRSPPDSSLSCAVSSTSVSTPVSTARLAAQSPLRSLNLTEVLISDYANNQICRRSSRHRFKPLETWRNERLLYERTPGSVMPSVCGVALNRDCPPPEVPCKKMCLDERQVSLVPAIPDAGLASLVPADGGLASNSDCGTLAGSDSNTHSTVRTPEMQMYAIVLSSHKTQSVAIPAFTRGILHCLQGELCFAVQVAGGSDEKDEVVLCAGDVFGFHGDEGTTVILPTRGDAKLIWVDVAIPATQCPA